MDTIVQVFCDGCPAPACIASNDNDPGCGSPADSSTVSWCSELGQTYLIQLGGAAGAQETFELIVTDDAMVCGSAPDCTLLQEAGAGEPGDSASSSQENETRYAPGDDGVLRPIHLHGRSR